ncbi:unnamed protein product [Discula destructiva]
MADGGNKSEPQELPSPAGLALSIHDHQATQSLVSPVADYSKVEYLEPSDSEEEEFDGEAMEYAYSQNGQAARAGSLSDEVPMSPASPTDSISKKTAKNKAKKAKQKAKAKEKKAAAAGLPGSDSATSSRPQTPMSPLSPSSPLSAPLSGETTNDSEATSSSTPSKAKKKKKKKSKSNGSISEVVVPAPVMESLDTKLVEQPAPASEPQVEESPAAAEAEEPKVTEPEQPREPTESTEDSWSQPIAETRDISAPEPAVEEPEATQAAAADAVEERTSVSAEPAAQDVEEVPQPTEHEIPASEAKKPEVQEPATEQVVEAPETKEESSTVEPVSAPEEIEAPKAEEQAQSLPEAEAEPTETKEESTPTEEPVSVPAEPVAPKADEQMQAQSESEAELASKTAETSPTSSAEADIGSQETEAPAAEAAPTAAIERKEVEAPATETAPATEIESKEADAPVTEEVSVVEPESQEVEAPAIEEAPAAVVEHNEAEAPSSEAPTEIETESKEAEIQSSEAAPVVDSESKDVEISSVEETPAAEVENEKTDSPLQAVETISADEPVEPVQQPEMVETKDDASASSEGETPDDAKVDAEAALTPVTGEEAKTEAPAEPQVSEVKEEPPAESNLPEPVVLSVIDETSKDIVQESEQDDTAEAAQAEPSKNAAPEPDVAKVGEVADSKVESTEPESDVADAKSTDAQPEITAPADAAVEAEVAASAEPVIEVNHEDQVEEAVEPSTVEEVTPAPAVSEEQPTTEPVKAVSESVEEVQPAPTVEDATPVAEEAASVVEETASVVEEATPVVEEATPVVEEAASVVEETASVVEEATPVVEEATPVVEEATPVAEEAAPVVEETASVVEAVPSDEKVAPIDEESTPAPIETSVSVEEGALPAEESTPAESSQPETVEVPEVSETQAEQSSAEESKIDEVDQSANKEPVQDIVSEDPAAVDASQAKAEEAPETNEVPVEESKVDESQIEQPSNDEHAQQVTSEEPVDEIPAATGNAAEPEKQVDVEDSHGNKSEDLNTPGEIPYVALSDDFPSTVQGVVGENHVASTNPVCASSPISDHEVPQSPQGEDVERPTAGDVAPSPPTIEDREEVLSLAVPVEVAEQEAPVADSSRTVIADDSPESVTNDSQVYDMPLQAAASTIEDASSDLPVENPVVEAPREAPISQDKEVQPGSEEDGGQIAVAAVDDAPLETAPTTIGDLSEEVPAKEAVIEPTASEVPVSGDSKEDNGKNDVAAVDETSLDVNPVTTQTTHDEVPVEEATASEAVVSEDTKAESDSEKDGGEIATTAVGDTPLDARPSTIEDGSGAPPEEHIVQAPASEAAVSTESMTQPDSEADDGKRAAAAVAVAAAAGSLLAAPAVLEATREVKNDPELSQSDSISESIPKEPSAHDLPSSSTNPSPNVANTVEPAVSSTSAGSQYGTFQNSDQKAAQKPEGERERAKDGTESSAKSLKSVVVKDEVVKPSPASTTSDTHKNLEPPSGSEPLTAAASDDLDPVVAQQESKHNTGPGNEKTGGDDHDVEAAVVGDTADEQGTIIYPKSVKNADQPAESLIPGTDSPNLDAVKESEQNPSQEVDCTTQGDQIEVPNLENKEDDTHINTNLDANPEPPDIPQIESRLDDGDAVDGILGQPAAAAREESIQLPAQSEDASDSLPVGKTSPGGSIQRLTTPPADDVPVHDLDTHVLPPIDASGPQPLEVNEVQDPTEPQNETVAPEGPRSASTAPEDGDDTAVAQDQSGFEAPLSSGPSSDTDASQTVSGPASSPAVQDEGLPDHSNAELPEPADDSDFARDSGVSLDTRDDDDHTSDVTAKPELSSEATGSLTGAVDELSPTQPSEEIGTSDSNQQDGLDEVTGSPQALDETGSDVNTPKDLDHESDRSAQGDAECSETEAAHTVEDSQSNPVATSPSEDEVRPLQQEDVNQEQDPTNVQQIDDSVPSSASGKGDEEAEDAAVTTISAAAVLVAAAGAAATEIDTSDSEKNPSQFQHLVEHERSDAADKTVGSDEPEPATGPSPANEATSVLQEATSEPQPSTVNDQAVPDAVLDQDFTPRVSRRDSSTQTEDLWRPKTPFMRNVTPAIVLPDADDQETKNRSWARAAKQRSGQQAEEVVAAAVIIRAAADTLGETSTRVADAVRVLKQHDNADDALNKKHGRKGTEGAARSLRESSANRLTGVDKSLKTDDKPPRSPRQHRSSHGSRSSRPSTREGGSKRHSSHRHRHDGDREGEQNSPQTPKRTRDTAESGHRSRKERTPQEQAEHDKRKEERRLAHEKAKNDSPAAGSKGKEVEASPSIERRSSRRHSASQKENVPSFSSTSRTEATRPPQASKRFFDKSGTSVVEGFGGPLTTEISKDGSLKRSTSKTLRRSLSQTRAKLQRARGEESVKASKETDDKERPRPSKSVSMSSTATGDRDDKHRKSRMEKREKEDSANGHKDEKKEKKAGGLKGMFKKIFG